MDEQPVLHNHQDQNDGGIVLVLFGMVLCIACGLFSSVDLYASLTECSPTRRLELWSAFANLGNAVTHVLLVFYIVVNADNNDEYWIEERKLGGMEGPVALTLINAAVGLVSLLAKEGTGTSLRVPLIWNSFVLVSGSLIPIVWPRFLAEGLLAWPPTIIFLWFCIFAFELTAVCTSVTQFLVVRRKSKSD